MPTNTDPNDLPPAYREAIREEVHAILRKSGEQIAAARGMSRRDVMKVGGYMALGAMVGGGGLYAATEPAQAVATGEIGTASSPIDKIYADEVGTSSNPVTSIATDELETKNETFVHASHSGDDSNNAIGAWVNAFDTQLTDVRSEFDENSNGRFNPDRSGKYMFLLDPLVFVGGDSSDGDEIQYRIQDVDAGSTVGQTCINGGFDNGRLAPLLTIGDLTAGTNYEFQVKNNTSAFRRSSNTRGHITPAPTGVFTA